MKMNMKIWFHEMNVALQDNASMLIDNADYPPCPKCSDGIMIYHGEAYGNTDGNDFYECPSCGFHIMFDDIPFEEL